MILDPVLDFFRGKAVTIPPMDGAFRPNTVLDDAEALTSLTEADNLFSVGTAAYATSGNALYRLESGEQPAFVETFAAPVSAVAIAPDGVRFIALENGVLLRNDRQIQLPAGIRCITAMTFDADETLWIANGSASHAPSAWAADLMEKQASGSVWKRKKGKFDFECVAANLAFPFGLAAVEGGILVSESWKHRLVKIDPSTGRIDPVLSQLPGYPARLSSASDGGIWLSMFAPRNRLIEFVLQEKQYRLDMMAQVPRAFWISPALSSNRSFMEPLQCGAIRSMGVHKPWSPSRSYGLVVKLDSQLRPVSSLHSRANGTRHGVMSAIELNGTLHVASKGGDCVIHLPLTESGDQ